MKAASVPYAVTACLAEALGWLEAAMRVRLRGYAAPAGTSFALDHEQRMAHQTGQLSQLPYP